MDKQKVIVYIDGFNFYYGLRSEVRWKPFYWIDLVKLFEMFMRPNQDLMAVKYFSAKIEDLDKSLRQNAFFQANRENSKFKLILGKYLKKSFPCFRCGNIISSNLATMGSGKPVQMKQFYSRFRQCRFPDVVHLKSINFDLHIPTKWKNF